MIVKYPQGRIDSIYKNGSWKETDNNNQPNEKEIDEEVVEDEIEGEEDNKE